VTHALLARHMPDAWPVFFSGRRPRPAQALVMPRILRGASILFAAPTAAGKTEAAIAPLFQRHRSFRRDLLSVVHIAPTKALVNDLHGRLTEYLSLRFPGAVRRYTGDRHEQGHPTGGFCLLATPEALDSLQLMHPLVLSGIRAVVVDEMHLLHGSGRGQQLRHVIRRIRKAAAAPVDPRDEFQVIGMTATLQRMEEVASLWLGPEGEAVAHGEAREIEAIFLRLPPGSVASAATLKAAGIATWLNEATPRKLLVFANTRNEAHALAAALAEKLAGTRWPVHMHIGILSAVERERVEAAMRGDRFGVCVATSTLEIGIDIGDVDAIALADPPLTISSFLQRIGRGNRQTDTCRVVTLCTGGDDENRFRALLDCARRGVLDEQHEHDRPAVRFQQILSLTWRAVRHGDGLSRRELRDIADDSDHEQVVSDMLATGALCDIRGALVPSDAWMDEGDARRIHTNLIGGAGAPVVDERTGDPVLTQSGPGASGGLVYVGGEFRPARHGADGAEFLAAPVPTRKNLALARLPSTRAGYGSDRILVWAMARLQGIDPTWWVRSRDRLETLGGLAFNRLLAGLLDAAGLGTRMRAEMTVVIGLHPAAEVSLPVLRTLAADEAALHRIPRSVARRFLEPLRFHSALSMSLQAEEERGAIPLAGFRRWLEECAGVRSIG
jgi:ATP-dependent Lhr-like helicase